MLSTSFTVHDDTSRSPQSLMLSFLLPGYQPAASILAIAFAVVPLFPVSPNPACLSMAAPLLMRLLPSRNPEHRRSVWGPRMPAKGSGRRPDAGPDAGIVIGGFGS